MELLHYTVDISELLRKQEQETSRLNQLKEDDKKQGLQNKKELLKYVLPLMHGLFALHNNRCTKDTSTPAGQIGLLGQHKINIEEKLQYIVDTDATTTWSDNFQVFQFDYFKVWLNKKQGCYVASNLPYSMTSVIKGEGVYGNSVESELEKAAKYCAKFTDNW